jgi:glycolate dehydrogenase FAD-binding subunit
VRGGDAPATGVSRGAFDFSGMASESGSGVGRFAAGGILPACAVFPQRLEEVQRVVDRVRERSGALLPAGRGVHLGIGAPPRRYDVALSTRALDRIVAHDAADMTVTVEAGVTVGQLNDSLRAAEQWLPLDPPLPEDTTVGGLIAADRNGPLRLSYGKVRDMLIGIAVVSASGEVLRGGGKVVKNVAGYDLPKLFTGSFGTLGVIVEATFKVQPRPPQRSLWVWSFADLAAATDAALALWDGALHPLTLEVVNGTAAESLGLPPGAGVIVEFGGGRAHLEEESRRLAAQSAAVRRWPAEREGALRRALCDFPRAADDDVWVARISTLPRRLPELLLWLERRAAEVGLTVEIAAHAGNGVAWCQLPEAGEGDDAPRLCQQLREVAAARRAWVVFESIPVLRRGSIDPWGYREPALRLMRGIKQALDPSGVFSPGRFAGGI